MKSLYEQEAVGDKQYAQELLNVQAWYNNEMKHLNDTLAKKRSDALVKYQERAKAMSAAEKSAAKPAQQQSPTQNQTGTVTTAGQPVNAQGNPAAPKVESYPDIDILRIKDLSEEFVDKYAHIPMCMRNWYQKPEAQQGYEEPAKLPKNPRKKKMSNKVQDKIWDLEGEIADLKQEIRFNKQRFESPSFEGAEGEIEQFFADLGPEASEILNSGAYSTDEEKVYALQKAGVQNAEQVIRDYYYYYPEFDQSLQEERVKAEKEIEEAEARLSQLEEELEELQSVYESLDESTFTTDKADPYELQDLKDYLDAENISYFEEEDGGVIDFDETELDKEWKDRIEDMGLEEKIPVEEPDDILSIEDDDDEETISAEVPAEEEDITDKDEQIDEDKVFYVKVTDGDSEFTGKVYKLFDEGDWRTKIVDGDSETFEKLSYDPDYDEFDIIAFLRENYDDAELVSEDEFNDAVEEPEPSKEDTSESLKHTIPTLDEFINEGEYDQHVFTIKWTGISQEEKFLSQLDNMSIAYDDPGLAGSSQITIYPKDDQIDLLKYYANKNDIELF